MRTRVNVFLLGWFLILPLAVRTSGAEERLRVVADFEGASVRDIEIDATAQRIIFRPGGDPTRGLPPAVGGRGLYDLLLNRGKKPLAQSAGASKASARPFNGQSTGRVSTSVPTHPVCDDTECPIIE